MSHKNLSTSLNILMLCILASSLLIFPFHETNKKLELHVTFDKTEYYPGELGTISITVKNNYDRKIRIVGIKIKFDWEQAYTKLKQSEIVKPHAISVPFSHNFNVPTNISYETNHSCKVIVEYKIRIEILGIVIYEEPFFANKQEEITENLWIENPQKRIIEKDLEDLRIEINNAKIYDFKSEDALYKLQDAERKYELARNAFNSRDWEKARSYIREAVNLIKEAYKKESEYWIIHAKDELKDALDYRFFFDESKNRIEQAEEEIRFAEVRYSTSDFRDSIEHAKESISLIKEAYSIEERLWKQNSDIAKRKLDSAKDFIEKAEKNPLVWIWIFNFKNALVKLNEAEEAYQKSDYHDAYFLSLDAISIAEKAREQADNLLIVAILELFIGIVLKFLIKLSNKTVFLIMVLVLIILYFILYFTW